MCRRAAPRRSVPWREVAPAACASIPRRRRSGPGGVASALLALVAPLHVRAAGSAVQAPSRDEEEVRETVEVLARRRAHLVALAELDQRALGAAADGAREVRCRGSARAARQDEFLQR